MSMLLLGKLRSKLVAFQLFAEASHAHAITYCVLRCTQGILSIFHCDVNNIISGRGPCRITVRCNRV